MIYRGGVYVKYNKNITWIPGLDKDPFPGHHIS